MKVILVSCVFLVFSSVAFATENEVPNFDMDEELSPEDYDRLKELIQKELKLHELSKLKSNGDINFKVDLNEFLDKLLANVRELIIEDNIDPTSLPDQDIDITVGQTNLTEGQLNDTSTIERYEDAVLYYDSDSERLVAEMVLRFEDLKFIFKYHTKVVLISMTGHLHGDIEHVHIHVKLGYDFAKGLVSVDSLDFQHTGDIKIWVTGNDLVDWITNAMTAVITGILHNVILDIVRDIVEIPINNVVDSINNALHPNATVF